MYFSISVLVNVWIVIFPNICADTSCVSKFAVHPFREVYGCLINTCVVT